MATRDVAIVPTKSNTFECVSGQNVVEMENYILYVQSGKGEPMGDFAKDTNVPTNDCVSRQAAIEALKGLPTWWADSGGSYGGAQPPMEALLDPEDAISALENLPFAQPTLFGYNIEHLKLIAYLLQKENLPPERVAEALNDISRIVEIVSAEFEETLRKAVEQCKI